MTLLAALPVIPAIRIIRIVPALVTRLRGFWRRIEPGLSISHDHAGTERWDGAGVGPGTCIAFEGFGISFSLFIGRTPSFRPYGETDRSRQLIRWYAGEAQARRHRHLAWGCFGVWRHTAAATLSDGAHDAGWCEHR